MNGEDENFESVFYCVECQHAVETIPSNHYWTEERVIPGQVVFEEFEVQKEITAYSLRRCPKCESPFLHKYDYLIHWEAGTVPQGTTKLYPVNEGQLLSVEALPALISETYEQAKKCYEQNLFEPSVIMSRKCLEGICLDLEAKGKNLSKKIEFLRDEDKIDKNLFDWANQLRLIGNDAAHDFNIKITSHDAKDTIIFLNALLLYIYTLNKKFLSFQKRRTKV